MPTKEIHRNISDEAILVSISGTIHHQKMLTDALISSYLAFFSFEAKSLKLTC